jgi:3-oxoacyl-[acyl-carrier-protein] synthase III
MQAAGIFGIGVYLPDTVRRNDWWPESVVKRWREKLVHRVERLPIPLTEGVQRALDAMSALKNDAFNGSVERRVMNAEQWSSEMETIAAQRALDDAGVAPSEIDAVISFTVCPDYLCGPTGAVVHQRLGLKQKCLTVSMESACNSFPVQLTLADQMIRSGRVRHVLLIQSAAFSKVVPIESPLSPWLGDGATAVVLGPVKEGYGVQTYAHGTDGSRHRAVVFGVPGKRWYEDGRVVCYSEDPAMAQAIILGSVDRAKDVIEDVLTQAGLTPEDVDFYACHQGVPWLRQVTQDFVGMTRARWVDTYTTFASLSAANIPLLMSIASREGTLRDGDRVTVFSGGTGETYAGVLLRWGGRG